jgi:tetratricopeptide (TPR) repeat protein
MKRPLYLLIPLLLVVAFSLAANLQPWSSGLNANSKRSQDPLSLLLGDARKMFANHFFTKADAYFHSGFYPTIYDNRESFRTAHIAEDAGAREGKNTGDEDHFLGHNRDWIDAFGRKFFPSVHTHLNEGGAETSGESSAIREILPWLKVSASLDPERVDTYSVTAYWLRSELKKPDEAEAFLREGLRANPGNPLLLFELGRIYREERKDDARARNVWEMALRNLGDLSDWEGERRFLIGQLLGQLAKLEESSGDFPRALTHLAALKQVSPTPEAIQKWMDEVKAKANPAKTALPHRTESVVNP